MMANCLDILGNIHFEMEDYKNAEIYLKKALKIRREQNDRRGMASTLNNLGKIFEKIGEYNEARIFYRLVFQIYQFLQDETKILESKYQ